MVPKKLTDWLQALGLFGVLGGLIFVGLQLLLDRQVALNEGTEAATSNRQYWAELVNTNAEVWVKGLAGDPLSTTEAVRFDALASAREMIYFNSFSRAGRGGSNQPPQRFVIEAAWELHGNPGFLKWWREARSRLDTTRQRLDLPDTSWGTAVKEELQRLESEDPAR